MNIYVVYASDFLTDNMPHGEGLISYELLKSLANKGHKIHAFSPNVKISNEIKNLFIYTSNVKCNFPSWKYWYYRSESIKIYNKLSKEVTFDLVWQIYPFGHTIPIMRIPGIKFVLGPLYSKYTEETIIYRPKLGFKISNFSDIFTAINWNLNLKSVNLILTESVKSKESLLNYLQNSYIEQVPVIVNSSIEISQRRLPNFQDSINISFVGNFHPSKRLLDFCKLAERIKKEGYMINAYIVGEGEDQSSAMEYCAINGMNSYVHFIGRLSNSDIYDFFKSMHFLITLREESYGRAIVEAMSVGTVNICVNKLAAKEFIVNNINGILLDKINIEDYVDTIVKLVQEPETWSKISNEAIYTSKQFRSEKVAIKLESIFKRLIKIN